MKGSCISTTQVVLSSLFCNVSFWLPSDWKSSKDVPRLNSSLEMLLHATFLALSHAYPRNYNHRCARFHFASLHLCPQLLCSSGPQESSPAFLGLKQGQSRTGPPEGSGAAAAVWWLTLPSQIWKHTSRLFQLFPTTKLFWESSLCLWLTHIWHFIAVSHNSFWSLLANKARESTLPFVKCNY